MLSITQQLRWQETSSFWGPGRCANWGRWWRSGLPGPAHWWENNQTALDKTTIWIGIYITYILALIREKINLMSLSPVPMLRELFFLKDKLKNSWVCYDWILWQLKTFLESILNIYTKVENSRLELSESRAKHERSVLMTKCMDHFSVFYQEMYRF